MKWLSHCDLASEILCLGQMSRLSRDVLYPLECCLLARALICFQGNSRKRTCTRFLVEMEDTHGSNFRMGTGVFLMQYLFQLLLYSGVFVVCLKLSADSYALLAVGLSFFERAILERLHIGAYWFVQEALVREGSSSRGSEYFTKQFSY